MKSFWIPFGLGALAMYFFDPLQGPRRRAQLRERFVQLGRQPGLAGKAIRKLKTGSRRARSRDRGSASGTPATG